MEINWGGSGIEKVVFDYIRENIPEGSTVIELGAGHVSTPALSEHYKLYSVEHNSEFANIYPRVNYIVADGVGWYDREKLLKELPPKAEQKMILIDGKLREGILQNLDLFNPNALYIIHDTYREIEIKLAHDLGEALGRKPVFHTEGDFWATI